MKICLTWKIIACGLLCVFPVDIKGQACQCTHANDRICKSCNVGCFLWYRRCYECPHTCYSCSSRSHCDICKTGSYGPTCNHDCISCRNGSCSKNTCTDGCADGHYYNSYCQPCRKTCVTCNSLYECMSCIAGRTGTYCEKCNNGYHLNNRQCIPCNTNCLHRKCNVYGDCTDGCKNGWSGQGCQDACSPTCASCQRDRKETCNSCPFDHYGTSCESECSVNCATHVGVRQCTVTNGECSFGCDDGWSGSKCTDKCNMNCISCDAPDTTVCHSCSPGFYGQSCENECSSNCVKTIDIRQCRKSDGHCTDGCVEGWTGSKCTEQCSAKCTSCDRQNGSACYSCKPGYYGPNCNIECSEYCGNGNDGRRQCQQDDGTCLDDCVMGYKGDKCDVPCDAGCRSICDRSTGVCDGGTQDTQKKDHVAVIVGVVGCAVMIVLVVAAVLVFMFLRKRRRKKSNPEERVTFDISLNIEDDNADDNVYSVPDKKRSANENVDKTQSTAHSTLPKLTPSKGPVTNEDFRCGNMKGVPIIPPRLSVDEPEDNVEELGKDEDNSGDQKDADAPNTENYYNIKGLTRSRLQVETLRDHVASISTENFEKEFKKLPKGLIRPYDDAIKPTNVSKNRYKGIYPYDSTRVKLTGNGGDYINASYVQGFDESEKTYIASSGPTDKSMKGYVEFWEMVWQEKVDTIVMLTNFMEESKMKCEKYWPDVGERKTYGDINVHCMSDERYADFTVTKLTMKKDSQVSSIHHFHFTAWPDRGTPENVVSLVEFRESVEHVPKINNGPIVIHCSAGIGRTGTYIALDILTREGRRDNHMDVYDCVLGLRGQRVLMVQNVEQYQFLHYALSHSLTNKCDQIASKDFCTVNTVEIQEQFQLLGTVNVLNGDEEKTAIEKNGKEKYKNRKGASIPGAAHRPRLFKYNHNSKSDYINAIYVDGYKEKNRYIIAQTPLSQTVEDFLGLVLQENCSCIISLDPVGISTKQCTEKPKTILHYQYTNWPEESPVPSSTRSFLNLVLESRRTVPEPNMQLEPVLIHCLAGGDRSSLFPVVANILEKINSEQQASIVNVVSQVRARRPRALPNKEQFKYCYELASLFVENNSVYSNLL